MSVKIKNVTTIKDDSGQERIVCKGKLLFIPNDPTEVHECAYIPVIFSETEEKENFARCLCLDELRSNVYPDRPYINPFTKWITTSNGGKGNDCGGCRKILVFPDEFSQEQLDSFLDHKFEHGGYVFVECENDYDGFSGSQRFPNHKIKLTDGHATLFPVKDKWEIIDEKMEKGLAAMESGEWKPKDHIDKTEKEETLSITKNELVKSLESAFKSGENWGVTYSTWFTPTKEDSDAKIREAINLILQHVSVFTDGLKMVDEKMEVGLKKMDRRDSTPEENWGKIGSAYLASAFNEHNKVMKMQFLEWLEQNYNAPIKK